MKYDPYYNLNFCKVCEGQIPKDTWIEHVKMHKIAFCKKFNLDPTKWYEVKWIKVIKVFNPSRYETIKEKQLTLI